MSKELHTSDQSTICRIKGRQRKYVRKQFARFGSDSSLEIYFHTELQTVPGVVRVLKSKYEPVKRLKLEYCKNGSMRTFLLRVGQNLPEDFLLKAFKSMLQTVIAMHKARIVHRALSINNWLVAENGDVKLTDFGHAKRIDKFYSDQNISLYHESQKNKSDSSHWIFAEDAVRLAQTFFHMSTRNLFARVLEYNESGIAQELTSLGYSAAVPYMICSLQQLNGISHQQVISDSMERILRLQPLTLPDPPLEQIKCCSDCGSVEDVRDLQCTHKICMKCARAKGYGNAVPKCGCEDTFQSDETETRTIPAPSYQFSFLVSRT